MYAGAPPVQRVGPAAARRRACRRRPCTGRPCFAAAAAPRAGPARVSEDTLLHTARGGPGMPLRVALAGYRAAARAVWTSFLADLAVKRALAARRRCHAEARARPAHRRALPF